MGDFFLFGTKITSQTHKLLTSGKFLWKHTIVQSLGTNTNCVEQPSRPPRKKTPPVPPPRTNSSLIKKLEIEANNKVSPCIYCSSVGFLAASVARVAIGTTFVFSVVLWKTLCFLGSSGFLYFRVPSTVLCRNPEGSSGVHPRLDRHPHFKWWKSKTYLKILLVL